MAPSETSPRNGLRGQSPRSKWNNSRWPPVWLRGAPAQLDRFLDEAVGDDLMPCDRRLFKRCLCRRNDFWRELSERGLEGPSASSMRERRTGIAVRAPALPAQPIPGGRLRKEGEAPLRVR